MTKADIVNEIAKSTGVEKIQVQAIVEAFMESVKGAMIKGENVYLRLRDARGFDEMDEYVDYLLLDNGVKQADIDRVEDALRSAAQSAETAIRKEGIEPQSVMAFHIFARVVKVFFALGLSVALYLMGYKYEKVKVELPS